MSRLARLIDLGHPHHGFVATVEACAVCMRQFHEAQRVLQTFDAKAPPSWLPRGAGGALVDAITAGR